MSGSETVVEQTKIKSWDDGAAIITEGQEGFAAYEIVEGEVAVIKKTPTGDLILSTLGSGQRFGESSALTSKPATASVIARGNVTARIYPRDLLLAQIRENPSQFLHLLDQQASHLIANQSSIIESYSDILDQEDKPGLFSRLFRNRDTAIQDFEPDYIRIEQEKPPAALKLAGLATLALIASAVIWSSLASVDMVIASKGKISPGARSVEVLAPAAGRLVSASYNNGQVVEKGEILGGIDQSVEAIDQQLTADKLAQADAALLRLQAELSGIVPERFSDIPAIDAAQRAVFDSNQQAHAEAVREKEIILATTSQEIARKRTEINVLNASVADKRELYRIALDLFEKTSETFQRATTAQQKMLEARQSLSSAQLELERAVTGRDTLRGEVERVQAEIRQLNSSRLAGLNEKIEQQQKEILELSSALQRNQAEQEQVAIIAPINGVIVEASASVPGSTISASLPLFRIIPTDSPIEFSIEVSPTDIARISLGQAVNIKLDALPFIKHGMAKGRVAFISEDTVASDDAPEGGKFYKVKVQILQANFENTPEGFRPYIGMTGSGEVIVGRRRIIDYFLEPILRSTSVAFREP